MNNEHTTRLPRIAARVHTVLARCVPRDRYAPALERVVAQHSEVTRHSKRLRICRVRGWTNAESREHRALVRRLDDLDASIRSLTRDSSAGVVSPPSLRTVLEDLHEIETEFGGIRFDSDEECIVATTEPIVLEDVALGCFELRLCLKTLAAGDALNTLRAVALNPNPCAVDDAVTHPHISAERICLGEATTAFQTALQAGRIADALQIARAVLQTYNPGSPYCALESWHGRACADCGYVTSESNICWCERCERDYCEECFSGCAACGEPSCRDCLCACPLCDECVCSGCLVFCTHCDQSACMSCLDDGLCPPCLETDEDEENEDDETNKNEIQEQAAIAAR